MKNNIIVSVIMPAYNASKYISEAIDSVLGQTLSELELIIINDGSTDDTVAIVEAYKKRDSRIVLLHQENKKQAAARNQGLKVVKGEWVAFIDSDDVWELNKLSIQLEKGSLNDVIFSSGLIFYQDENREEVYKTESGVWTGNEMYKMLYNHNPIPNLAVLMRSSWIQKIGMQDESLNVVGCEDWDYWIKLALGGASFCGIGDKLFIYRIHREGTSRNKLKMMKSEANVLYNNINYDILDKSLFHARMIQVIRPLEYGLLFEGRTAEALSLNRMLLTIKPSWLDYYRFVVLLFGSKISRCFATKMLVIGDSTYHRISKN